MFDCYVIYVFSLTNIGFVHCLTHKAYYGLCSEQLTAIIKESQNLRDMRDNLKLIYKLITVSKNSLLLFSLSLSSLLYYCLGIYVQNQSSPSCLFAKAGYQNYF